MTWKERIERAKQTEFTQEDTTLASDFTTCAVGERLGLTDHARKAPHRETSAYQLGIQFWYAVIDNDATRAERIYQEIQTLSSEGTVYRHFNQEGNHV